jgi:hypothetical protein
VHAELDAKAREWETEEERRLSKAEAEIQVNANASTAEFNRSEDILMTQARAEIEAESQRRFKLWQPEQRPTVSMPSQSFVLTAVGVLLSLMIAITRLCTLG